MLSNDTVYKLADKVIDVTGVEVYIRTEKILEALGLPNTHDNELAVMSQLNVLLMRLMHQRKIVLWQAKKEV